MGFDSVGVIPGDVQEFFLHWQVVGKTGLIPRLQDFLDFPPFKLQSEVAIVDVGGEGDLRFRLFGTGLSSLAGRDWTGMDVLTNFHPSARAEAMRTASLAVSRPCGYFVTRYVQRVVIETRAIGIGLPFLNDKSGQVGLLTFSSLIDRTTQVIAGEAESFVRAVPLMRWIDIGAGIPGN